MFNHKKNYRKTIKQKQDDFRARYWNTSNIELAYGQSFSFNPVFSESIDSLKLSKTGNAVWLNDSLGIGRHLLLNGIGRVIQKTDFLRATTIDSTTSESNTSVTKKNLLTYAYGINLRYGSIRYSFFIESFSTYENIIKPIIVDGVDTGNDIESVERIIILSYGGDLKLSNSVMLSYGIRTVVDKNLNFRGMVPIAAVTCLMK